MKFQKLTIHNIASIEDAVIDFEAEPLASSEVFLITGKTGSGKSTILDSICLALYNSTPRLSSTKMEGETLDSADSSVKVKDVRQLMRRNTGEASVTLTFTGSNGVHYEATWAVARARKKQGGKIQKTCWQLENLDTHLTLSKIKEIEAEIDCAVGLDFNQFCRTTMLAQGEFTRFLNSNDNDKAAILEKITGVDIYSKVGAKIYEVAALKRQEWNDAQHAVEGVVCLTADEIADRKEQMANLDKKQAEIKKQKDVVAKKLDWIKRDQELASAISKAAEERDKAKAAVESEAFKERERMAAEWNAAADARRWLAEADAASKEVAAQQTAIGSLRNAYAMALGGREYARQEMAGVGAEAKAIDEFLESEKSRAAVYANSQTIIAQLAIIDEGRREISRRTADIGGYTKLLNDKLTPALDKIRKEYADAKQELQRRKAAADEQEQAVNSLNLAALRRQRDEAKDLLLRIAQAKERLESLADAKAKMEQARKGIAQRKADIEEKRKKADAMLAPIHDAKLRMDVRKEDLDRQKDTVDKFATTLRMRLRIGDTCPVCRQKVVAEMPHEDEVRALVDGLQREYDKAEKLYNDLTGEKTALDSDVKAVTQAYERDLAELNADASVDKAMHKAVEACRACGIDMAIGEETASLLDTKKLATMRRQEQLDAKIADGEKMETAVKAQRRELDNLRKSLEALDVKMKNAENAATECKGKIEAARAVVSAKTADVDNAENAVAGFIGDGVWTVSWRERPKEFGDKLSAAASLYNNKVERRQSLLATLSTLTMQCQSVDAVLTAIVEAMPEWSAVRAERIAKADRLIEYVNGISNRLTAALTQLKSAETKRREDMSLLDGFLADNVNIGMDRLKMLCACTAEVICGYEADAKRERENVAAKNTLFVQAQEQRSMHSAAKPELAEEETPESLSAVMAGYDEETDNISVQKGGISQELKADADNKVRLGDLIKAADAKKEAYQKWESLNQLIGDATGNKFRKIAQSYVLTSLIHSANSYMKTLTDRYTLRVNPGTFVISLEDAYQGYASRAATTISGGESFLVSLSLALALSDIGQQWQVDTLFIDEGFGTLSGEPLQKAVETLRSLHSRSGRHVGIISHVEELKERIPVQIQVNQDGNNSSSSVSVVS